MSMASESSSERICLTSSGELHSHDVLRAMPYLQSTLFPDPSSLRALYAARRDLYLQPPFVSCHHVARDAP